MPARAAPGAAGRITSCFPRLLSGGGVSSADCGMPCCRRGSAPHARESFAWHIPGSSGQYLKLSSWMFLEPGLDFDHVQLSFLLDFYLTDAKLNLISFFFFFFLLQTEENTPSNRSPPRSDTLFRVRLSVRFRSMTFPALSRHKTMQLCRKRLRRLRACSPGHAGAALF